MASGVRLIGVVLALVCPATLCPGQSAADLPTETDTIRIGGPVTLKAIQGDLLRKEPTGDLVSLSGAATVEPGDVILVRKGASFSIGGERFGPEFHGDRWVQFQ